MPPFFVLSIYDSCSELKVYGTENPRIFPGPFRPSLGGRRNPGLTPYTYKVRLQLVSGMAAKNGPVSTAAAVGPSAGDGRLVDKCENLSSQSA